MACFFFISIVFRLVKDTVLRWIKIIIKLNSVHNIILNNLFNSVCNILSYFRICRLQIFATFIFDYPPFFRFILTPLCIRVILCQFTRIGIELDSKRIHPCMDFQTVFMCRFHHIFQRIVARVLPLCAR